MAESQPTQPSGPRGMGRGLAAILPTTRADEAGLREIPLDLIRPNPAQPRRHFDEQGLVELSESIQAQGLLQPVVVRPVSGGGYELVAGERRVRAARLAGLERVPAVVRDVEDAERLELALAENVARIDLNPVEEARACALLVDDLGLSKREVGRRVGKSRVAVSNLIRLLELPDEALELIASGALSEGHGRAILTCQDHDRRRLLAREARDAGWSVRETERRARPDERAPTAPRAAHVDPELADALAAAEDALTAAVGQEVKVRAVAGEIVAELRFDAPGEAVELAERLLRRGGPRLHPVA